MKKKYIHPVCVTLEAELETRILAASGGDTDVTQYDTINDRYLDDSHDML